LSCGWGDDDLAERVQKSIGNSISRSVSYLAAPTFAAAMLEHQVLPNIPVGQHKTGSPVRARPGLRSVQIFHLVLLSQL
jgi:hypothetical protein